MRRSSSTRRRLADGAQLIEDKFSGARVFALPELSKRASYAFWEAMANRKDLSASPK